ncbi:beta-ketoacyl synthase chain length factor [Parafilimonas terrae]|uniref:3-oxoacyl-(Acyl-carrier-protein) synthase n=1 Tax=Parafilimonas terrae TaxID=1465490 RepID=A0A1I5Z7N1_9BACT|nr:beta-ketoacyl synthase chain length factor [Parafilimonas terrae]SFQ52454.1 3-oxoacyl-(acyl-carrier-protein) synthase [Parafilimonas terrae]
MKKIFIRSASYISAQETFNNGLFTGSPIEYTETILPFAEPSYKDFMNARQLRRMSKVVRTGVTTALRCLKDAGIETVDAIVSGTSYGCMEDSEAFLKSIVLQNEQALSPTSFIQSTHNLVSAQIALTLKCHNYNTTYAHRGFSFEHALTDAVLLLNEQSAENALAGSADEMTGFTWNVLRRFGLFKQQAVSNLSLFNSNTRGSIAGQGSGFFLLSGNHNENDYAQIDGIELIYKAGGGDVKNEVARFLSAQKINAGDIDLIITGRNGDMLQDKMFDDMHNTVFANVASINYKHLCGEYPTSSSFALWLAANIIKQKQLPPCFEETGIDAEKINRILIYNCYQYRYHSFILISKCN